MLSDDVFHRISAALWKAWGEFFVQGVQPSTYKVKTCERVALLRRRRELRGSMWETRLCVRAPFLPLPAQANGLTPEHEFIPQTSVAIATLLYPTLQETSTSTHDVFAVSPDLKVSILHPHRSYCRQKLRPVVGLLAPRQSERAVPVVSNTEEDATACSSESRILIADAGTIGLRHNTVCYFEFHFQISKQHGRFLAKVLQSRDSGRAPPPHLPKSTACQCRRLVFHLCIF